jgi:hypothetical protein
MMQKDSPSSLWRTSAAADALDWLHDHGWLVESDMIGETWNVKVKNSSTDFTTTGNTLAAALIEAVVQVRNSNGENKQI